MLLTMLAATAHNTPLTRTVSSESGLRLSPQPSVSWRVDECPASASIRIESAEQHQEMGGFGASMLEAGAMNLNALPHAKQSELLEMLFGRSGARLSAMKATMLGNDFSTASDGKWTTYDDTPEDLVLKDFSIARDLGPAGSVTFIKRALAAGFEGTIQAYMDYAPDWMYVDANTSKTLRTDCYDALALYMAKYVEAYASHGVPIAFLEAFNEPTDSYTQMDPTQLATFLGRHLGPTFETRGLWPKQTKLTYGGQCARATAALFVPHVLADEHARRYMDVIAYHGYDCQFNCTDDRQNYNLIAEIAKHDAKRRPIWMTEICYAYNGDDPNCTTAATLKYCVDYPRNVSLAPALPRRDFGDGATWGHRIVKEVQAGASGWIYWNLLLDTRGGPFNLSPSHNDGPGNYQHPVVIVDVAEGEFHPTGLFYFLAHFARFVRPGAVRIGTHDGELAEGVSAVGFATPDDSSSTVLQIVNRAATTRRVTVCSGGSVADVELPATSITTAEWRVQDA